MPAPLQEFLTTTLDASGYGVVTFIPQNSSWVIDTVNISTFSTTGAARTASSIAHLYLGGITEAQSLDTSSTGDGDTSGQNSYQVSVGQWFIVEWVGGTPGFTAKATVTGTKTIPTGGWRAV